MVHFFLEVEKYKMGESGNLEASLVVCPHCSGTGVAARSPLLFQESLWVKGNPFLQ